MPFDILWSYEKSFAMQYVRFVKIVKCFGLLFWIIDILTGGKIHFETFSGYFNILLQILLIYNLELQSEYVIKGNTYNNQIKSSNLIWFRYSYSYLEITTYVSIIYAYQKKSRERYFVFIVEAPLPKMCSFFCQYLRSSHNNT